MADDKQKKWNKIYAQSNQTDLPVPCDVLSRYHYLLPSSGCAVDLACGLGGNALFLANKGLETTAVDISAEAIDRLENRQHPLLKCVCQSIDSNNIGHNLYDVVVVSRFLERSLCDAMVGALLPGGLLFYQTFVSDKADPEIGPGNANYLLASNELLTLFSELQVVVFSDEATVGNVAHGFRNQSFIVGRRKE